MIANLLRDWLRPRNARAYCERGTAYAQAGDLAQARRHLARAVELDPGLVEAHTNLGNVHRLAGDARAAEASYREALRIAPQSAGAAYNLALILKAASRLPEALELLRAAHRTGPGETGALWELGLLLIELGRCEEARQVAGQACAERPADPLAHKALAVAHQHLLDPATALEAFDRALALDPLDAHTHALRAIVLQELLRLDEALATLDRALELDPGNAVARWRRALVHLMRGDFRRGWPEYEVRFASGDRVRRAFPCPRWRGETLQGKTILVHAEQGLGDEIMFASCLPDLAETGARLVLDCHPKLAALFARSFPRASIHAGPQSPDTAWLAGYPAPDYEIPAGSLPLHLRMTAERFPAHQGYLTADPEKVSRWRARLAALGPGLKVGLSWRGGTAMSRTASRSLDLPRLLPILRTPGIHFVDLQYSAGAPEIAALEREHGARIVHWQEALDDYDETAALVCALDLVLTVCTAVVHLTGALGRTAWVMTPHSPEWRYGHAGERMPWYPAVRLIRQERHGDWDAVIATVGRRLQHAAKPAERA